MGSLGGGHKMPFIARGQRGGLDSYNGTINEVITRTQMRYAL